MTDKHYAEITPAKGTFTAHINETALASSSNAQKLLEHHFGKIFPPVFYIPREDIDFSRLVKNESKTSHCLIKGDASYYSLNTEDGLIENIAWSYEDPINHVAGIKDYLAFDGNLVRISHP